MTCRECKNYEACDTQKKILLESCNVEWIDEPQLCTYVEIICQKFDKKESKNER